MAASVVSLVSLKDYGGPQALDAIRKSVDLIGGWGGFLKPQDSVFVKINHLSTPAPVSAGIVTHPLFTRDVLRILKEWTPRITVGDDVPSGPVSPYLQTGYEELCREMGVRLVNLKRDGFRETACPGQLLKHVHLARAVLEADVVINLPKHKTHSFTAFTGAVKNLFGTIPHGERLLLHRKYPGLDDFSRVLVDILSARPPDLTIMDGVVAMEGSGPAAGLPRRLGAVISGRDAAAVDSVASAIAGFDPEADVPVVRIAGERGLGTVRLSEIDLRGGRLEDFRIHDFRRPVLTLGLLRNRLPNSLYAFFQSQLVLIPYISRERCRGCGDCLSSCPRNAIVLNEGKAAIRRGRCLCCLCCHEVCPQVAVRLKQRPLGAVIRMFGAVHRHIRSLAER